MMTLTPRARVRLLGMMGLALAVTGCDTLGMMNPFEEKETHLPGERHAVFAESGAKSEGASVSVAPARLNADWAQPGGDPSNAPGNLSLQGGGHGWRSGGVSLGSHDVRIGASPIVYQGRIFVYTDDGNVSAYSLSGGGRLWSSSARPDGMDPKSVPGGGVAAADGRVVAVTGYRTVAAFSTDNGGRLWRVDIPDAGRGAPTVAGGKAYIVTAKNTVIALNLADGSQAWTYEGIPDTEGLISAVSPAVSGNLVIVPSSAGEVIALDIAKGEPKWQGSLARAARAIAVSGMSDVAARPVAVGGVVYATGVSGRMVALKEATGQLLWEKAIASAHTPAVSGNGIFVITLENQLVALDRNTGKTAWVTQLPMDKRENWAGPTLADGNLWAGSSSGRLVAVNAATGQMVSEKQIGSPVYIAPVVASGTMIVLSAGGTLTAVQ